MNVTLMIPSILAGNILPCWTSGGVMGCIQYQGGEVGGEYMRLPITLGI